MVKLTLINTGRCYAPGKVAVRTWSWKKRTFPATVAVLEHPTEGIILFDTGYTDAFFSATHRFPYRFYRWVTPVDHSSEQSVRAQLETMGVAADDVRAIFVSHFHADHCCGLKDFPKAEFICSEKTAESMQRLSGLSAVATGFLPDLVPEDFADRTRVLNEDQLSDVGVSDSEFAQGVDLFGDRSLVAIFLPGHARGQMGLLVNQEQFLVADAAWSRAGVVDNNPPHLIAHLLHEGKREYEETFEKLHMLTKSHPNVRLIPTHCWETFMELSAS